MEKIWEQKQIGSMLDMSRFSVDEKSIVEHQTMMGRIRDAGWLTGQWIAVWGRLIKKSGINDYDLERLIRYAFSNSSKFNPCGFVRNRLRDKDWHKFNLPK